MGCLNKMCSFENTFENVANFRSEKTKGIYNIERNRKEVFI